MAHLKTCNKKKHLKINHRTNIQIPHHQIHTIYYLISISPLFFLHQTKRTYKITIHVTNCLLSASSIQEMRAVTSTVVLLRFERTIIGSHKYYLHRLLVITNSIYLHRPTRNLQSTNATVHLQLRSWVLTTPCC